MPGWTAIMCNQCDDTCTHGPYGNGNPSKNGKRERHWKTTRKQEMRFWMYKWPVGNKEGFSVGLFMLHVMQLWGFRIIKIICKQLLTTETQSSHPSAFTAWSFINTSFCNWQISLGINSKITRPCFLLCHCMISRAPPQSPGYSSQWLGGGGGH